MWVLKNKTFKIIIRAFDNHSSHLTLKVSGIQGYEKYLQRKQKDIDDIKEIRKGTCTEKRCTVDIP